MIMHDWSAKQYSVFLEERTLPSKDLVAKINLTNPKKIIDIGSGPGNSTNILHQRFPNAQIIGADLSDDMLSTSRANYPSLEFIKFDATKDFSTLPKDFDIVYSNACIQWLPNHEEVIKNMFSVLAPKGVLAVQVPVNIHEPIHVCLEALGKSEQWFSKIGITSVFYNESQSSYFDILSDLTDDFSVWETTYCHRVPSHQSIIEWYKGSALRPYLAKLSVEEGELFCHQLYDRIEKEYKFQKNGEILLKFPRFFFTATKH